MSDLKFSIKDTLDIAKDNQELITPGLTNFEGNCYLNSVLQCFYYCDDLTNYFLNNEMFFVLKINFLSFVLLLLKSLKL